MKIISGMDKDGYRIRDQHATHFITFSVIQWIDVFTKSPYADIIVESLSYCRKEKELMIYAFCIMPNHLHLILRARGSAGLSDILRDFKKFTSGKIIHAIRNNEKESRRNWMLWIFKKAGEHNRRNNFVQFWQQDNHPVECSSPEIFLSKFNYVHENPVRAGMVWHPEDYRYSSAVNYYTTRRGLREIDS